MTDQPSVLLVGYNGANNAGAEARVVAAIDDVRAVMGPRSLITVPTLNVANTLHYIRGEPNVRLVAIPPVYFRAMRDLVREHDLILLVEGSVYMDTWSSLLLWYFLWSTRVAHADHKLCVAYAVDVGGASAVNRRNIRREASKTNLIITRTHAAADTLRDWGVTAPLEVTADTAVNFSVAEEDQDLLAREWPEARAGAVGMAMVDFYRFPVVLRPWGRRTDLYQWPVFFAHSAEQRRQSDDLVAGYVAMADRLVEHHGRHVAFMCMEGLDETIAHRVQAMVRHPNLTRIFTAKKHNASQMASLLRSLDLLVTARYHGSVLALAGQRPQIAFGHDLRLKTLYEELGLYPEFFVDAREPDRFERLDEAVERLLARPELETETLRRGYQDHAARARQNRTLLAKFVSAHGWESLPWAA